MKTVRELAIELGVSKSTLHRLIHDCNFETVQNGNKRLIDETIEKAIIQELDKKSLHGETFKSKPETVQKRSENDARNNSETFIIITELKEDKEFLKAQLAAKDDIIKQLNANIAALTAEREQERKERQTILAELLALRGQKKIEVKAQAQNEPRPSAPRGGVASSHGAAVRSSAPKKRSLFDRLFKR